MRLIICILILFPFGISAQKLQDVEHSLDTIKKIENRIEFLNNWTSKNYKIKPEESEYYAHQIITHASKIHNYTQIGNALITIGIICNRKGKYDDAILAYNRAIYNFSKEPDSLGINRTYHNRGNIYRIIGKYNFALKDYYKCLLYFKRIKNPKALSIIYNSIGITYKSLKEYDKAFKYYNKSAIISKENNLISSLYLSNTNIANLLSIQNNFKKALEYYKQNLIVLKKTPNKYRLAQTYHNIGTCFLIMKQYDLSIEYQTQSLALKEEIGNKNLIISSLNGLSHANYIKENYKKALQYSKRAYQLGKEIGNVEFQNTSTEDISKIYTYENQADSAIFYFNIHEQLRDSIINIETLREVNEIQAKYEAEKQEAQINLLEKKNKNRVIQRNGLIVILVLIAGYAVFIISAYYRNKRTTKLLALQKTRIEWANGLLDVKNQDLQQSNQTKNKLFQIISHDLRSPLASISGISDLIQIFVKQNRYHELNNSSKELKEYVSCVLNLTDNLLSWSLNQHGKLPNKPIAIQIKSILENIISIYKPVAQQKNINLELMVDNDLFVFADRPMLETVIRNLVNNAIKFTPEGGVVIAGAKNRNDKIEIWVKDSGIGIPLENQSSIFELENSKSKSGTRGERGNGLGLILCKDFIAQNKGEIWVESKENIGSTFRFTIPKAINTNQKSLNGTDVLTS